MKADHKFYKAHGIYDFPLKQKKRILQMKLVGQINQYIIGSHEKVIQEARQSLSLPQRHYKNTSFKQTACRSNMTGRL